MVARYHHFETCCMPVGDNDTLKHQHTNRYLIGSLHADFNLIRSGHWFSSFAFATYSKNNFSQKVIQFKYVWRRLDTPKSLRPKSQKVEHPRKKHRIHRNVASHYNRIVWVIFRWHEGNDIYALDRNPYHLPTLVSIMNVSSFPSKFPMCFSMWSSRSQIWLAGKLSDISRGCSGAFWNDPVLCHQKNSTPRRSMNYDQFRSANGSSLMEC